MQRFLWVIALLLIAASSVCSHAQESTLPAWYYTTSDLNLRLGPGTNWSKVDVVTKGTNLKVVGFEGKWAKVEYSGRLLYCSSLFLEPSNYREPAPTPTPTPVKTHTTSWWAILLTLLWKLVLTVVACAVLRKLLLWGAAIYSTIAYKLYWIVSLPFYFLNWLQRFLAKPWRIAHKRNNGNNTRNSELREIYQWLQLPLYIVLTPLRAINAFYYNIIVHLSFEAMNLMLEVIYPTRRREGADDWLQWAIWLPLRIIIYPVYHGSLTVIESIIWTAIDTVMPALTLFHGTDESAAESITQARGRTDNETWYTEVWNVGGGNYAGNGIYFAPDRSTAMHYSSGALIVCRVTLGRVLDLGIAPYHIYRQCGYPNAVDVTNWGLRNGYTTGEWWRSDRGWWEYCMYDRKNRYNDSWRIRPIFVLSNNDEMLQRIPGGMHHWLFRKMVINDILYTLNKKFN
ncbi:MAG: SH3 domain-containing protein [Muribaculaceae bacterium]